MLPKVYENKINKKINNNKDYYYSKLERNNRHVDVRKEIDNIFRSSDFVYKAHVLIELKEETLDTYLVSRAYNYLLDMNAKKIYIDDIIDIKKIN